MNKKQLIRLGVPEDCVREAVDAVQRHAKSKTPESERPKKLIPKILDAPEVYLTNESWCDFARRLIQWRNEDHRDSSIEYCQWGEDLDKNSRQQMANACRLPMAVGAALMPDAHSGYGLPIGGVLALKDAVVPYAVGVDIACRMKMTVTDLPVEIVEQNNPAKCRELDASLEEGTLFGVGKSWKRPYHHDVLDEDWSITAVTREVQDRAREQLGSSGSGNHFVEWGILTLPENELGLDAGQYVALLSHSGSRGAGARVCQRYSDIARRKLPARFRNDSQLRHLGWLNLEDAEGQEYWAAMNLMGQYASANHAVIHRNVTRLAGAQVLATVENHHNFAWEEVHDGQTVFVHRKGATPAGAGVLGVIPGNMADSAFVVRGKGLDASLHSASHGAGRRMSRTEAKRRFRWGEWHDHLKKHNVRLLSAGLDEVPGAYKNIHDVMAAQTDLVEVVGEFMPRIVKMCGDGSRPED
ncbi:MAG: RtcB family protein [Pirellulaceae bacterium]